jgi:hypothetical protein
MNPTDEKREFYRIDDEITMEFTPASSDDVSEALSLARALMPEAFQTLSQLRQIDGESQQLMQLIQNKHREIAAYLKIQNKKINLLAKTIASQLKGDFKHYQVNISGKGLRFVHSTALPVDSLWQLRILLFPDCVGLACIAKVIACEPVSKGYQVVFEFTDILQQDQDALIKHITQLQSEQLRKERLES